MIPLFPANNPVEWAEKYRAWVKSMDGSVLHAHFLEKLEKLEDLGITKENIDYVMGSDAYTRNWIGHYNDYEESR